MNPLLKILGTSYIISLFTIFYSPHNPSGPIRLPLVGYVDSI